MFHLSSNTAVVRMLQEYWSHLDWNEHRKPLYMTISGPYTVIQGRPPLGTQAMGRTQVALCSGGEEREGQNKP
eukprot:COSAG05_NODE_676_length_7987_cov_3.066041_6_plen_73_part_00